MAKKKERKLKYPPNMGKGLTYEQMMAHNKKNKERKQKDSTDADLEKYPFRYTPEGQQDYDPETGKAKGEPQYKERKFKTEKEAQSSKAEHQAIKRYESGEATDEDLKLLKITDYNQAVYRKQHQQPGYAESQQAVSDSAKTIQDYDPWKTRKRERDELDDANYQKSEEERKKEHGAKVEKRKQSDAEEKNKLAKLEELHKWRNDNMVYQRGDMDAEAGWFPKTKGLPSHEVAKMRIKNKRIQSLEKDLSANPYTPGPEIKSYQPGVKPPATTLKKRDYQKSAISTPTKKFKFK